ncbi:ryncolin-1-like [Drosophila takahashii]|uniref:ryncolin-1-like n=1 Tax=Drosophila takahashii TaxID=29030 RepID=UPI001CF80F00|nr:ryncolin-1-like [Drosophila takahashii]
MTLNEEQIRQTDILERLDKKFDSCTPNSYPESCAESSKKKLVIRVPEYSEDPFEVSCDQESHGGGWTVILRRNDGSQDFFLEWKDYKKGFGDLDNEFFMGLDKMHAMTSEPQDMLVLVEDYNGNQGYELYDDFRVGPEGNNYTLESVGKFSGTAGDSLTVHQGMQFSTKDRNNDFWKSNCAVQCGGAWWYEACYWSNLCGTYGQDNYPLGVYWANKFIKRAVMMIRPKAYFLKHVK